MLSLSLIAAHCTPDSLSRGQAYYAAGRVGPVVQQAGQYQATVTGTTAYQLWLEVTADQLAGQCSCPYAGPGLCKHLVAAALAVQAGAFTVAGIAQAGGPDSGYVARVFEAAPPWARAAFLTQLFHRQPALRAAFEALQQGAAPWPPRLKVAPAAAALQAEVKRLTTTSYAGAAEAQAAVAAKWAVFWAPFAAYQTTGDAGNALRLYLAAYEAWDNLPAGPAAEALTACRAAAEAQVRAWVGETVHSLPRSKHLIALIMGRWDAHERAGGTFRYRLADFTPLLQVIVASPVSARYLALQLEAYGLADQAALASLRTYLAAWTQ